MIKKDFFSKDIYVFEPDEYLQHIDFLDLVLIAKPKWIEMGRVSESKWNFIKNHGLCIGVYNVSKENPNYMTVCSVLLKENLFFLVEITSDCCPNCNQCYQALYIRDYLLYVGLSDSAYKWAINDIPYITKCLNCGHDWHEQGMKYLAIFQNDKKKYAI